MTRPLKSTTAFNPDYMKATMDGQFNGWANWETWNVSLWIQNDEGLYRAAKDCKGSYAALVELLWDCGSKETPDGCRWNDLKIDTEAICEMMDEL
jgi:hypothetical protein